MTKQKSLSLLESSVQFNCSVVSNSLRPHGLQHPRLLYHQLPNLLKFMSIESVMPSNCHPLLLLPSIFPSIRVFSNESVLPIKWPNYWGFNSVPVVVQLLSLVQLFAALWTTTHQSSRPSLTPRVCSNLCSSSW